ncbi:MAG: MFS transporter [Pseudomonadaceae bacterium]|nr:MFS transporter [Pseudomonadaceae bacterium]
MSRNRLQLLFICQSATLIIAGVVTTIGLLVPSAAEQYGVQVTDMAAQFSWFTGASMVGQLFAFFIFDHISIKRMTIASLALCGGALAAIHWQADFDWLFLWLFLFGFGISLALTGAGTQITLLWQGRARQTAIVAQDAMFNGGGFLYAWLATWFLTRDMPFSSVYLVVLGIIAVVVLLAMSSDFEAGNEPQKNEEQEAPNEWNARIVLLGVSLLLFMLAKISMFIWAPQLISERFADDSAVAGDFMSSVFATAFFGSIAGTWLVSKINVRLLVYGFVGLSLASVVLLVDVTSQSQAMLLAFAYGLSVSATFNAYTAYALAQVSIPGHRNIAYLLLMSTSGSALAPLVSASVVERTGELSDALTFSAGILAVVVITLAVVEWLGIRNRRQLSTATNNA